ncbi:hypothetical protein RhiirA4_470990 [Rhizophagus irregularis]|uniref:F-box domain-containing protein n=1 Tax=Rhizophagus irregularis TaxID=588596 RepID=A0A2I1H2A0_9GLOM|nr:hypothetical protein RhiirA4_470990 [Rhizophagus irregularis]
MSKLNKVYSCLLVNRSWYEMTVPILWKDPFRFLLKDKARNIIILLYLSEESRDNLRNQEIVLKNTYQHSLLNYISFWKYLNLDVLERMIEGFTGTELCFSELRSFCSNSTRSNDILAEELAILNTSIKRLSFDILCCDDNPGIIKLIESQKNLKEVKLFFPINNETIVRPIEESLIKCAGTKLELFGKDIFTSFKISKKLNASHLKILANLIENTKGNFIEISIIYDQDEGRLIRAIYQNYPNLNYLKLSLFNENISEFENLLINCRILNGLEIISKNKNQINWKILFEVLTISAPISLFKFKFIYYTSHSYSNIYLESFRLFLDNWER